MRSIKIISIFLVISIAAYAQKLPKVQEAGLRAPDNIKIDGKPTEWNNKFQAYNPSTAIYYTIANDDKNLYLVIQVKDYEPMVQIGHKGITFTIQKSGEKTDQNGIGITYPTTILSWFSLFEGRHPKYDSPSPDSIMVINNNLIQKNVKYIVTTGIKDMDTISIYNEYGIKAVSLFDNKKVYTYELAVPLKVLGLSINDATKFAYNIRLNGSKLSGQGKIYTNPGWDPETAQLMRQMLGAANAHAAVMSAPKDFWGEYTLAKN